MTDKKESEKYIPPLSDTMMSKIFESMETSLAAKSLIDAVLEDAGRKPLSKITNLRCQETFQGRVEKGRSCRLDITAETEGHKINIEIQRSTDKDMIDRSFFYGCAMLYNSMSASEKFSSVSRFTLINLLDFKPLRGSHPDFHQPIKLMYEKGDKETASDIFTMHNIEIKKFLKIPFNMDNALHRWLYYLKKGYINPESAVTKEVIKMDTGIRQFAEKYNLNLQDPYIYEKYIQEKMAVMEYNTDISIARSEGKAEGKAEVVINMLAKNKTMSEIIDITDLSKEQILKIQNNNSDLIKECKAQFEEKQKKAAKNNYRPLMR